MSGEKSGQDATLGLGSFRFSRYLKLPYDDMSSPGAAHLGRGCGRRALPVSAWVTGGEYMSAIASNFSSTQIASRSAQISTKKFATRPAQIFPNKIARNSGPGQCATFFRCLQAAAESPSVWSRTAWGRPTLRAFWSSASFDARSGTSVNYSPVRIELCSKGRVCSLSLPSRRLLLKRARAP